MIKVTLLWMLLSLVTVGLFVARTNRGTVFAAVMWFLTFITFITSFASCILEG